MVSILYKLLVNPEIPPLNWSINTTTKLLSIINVLLRANEGWQNPKSPPLKHGSAMVVFVQYILLVLPTKHTKTLIPIKVFTQTTVKSPSH
jgi:hypothetical protein